LPETFTPGELQALCEQLLGHWLDKSSVRRKLDAQGAYRPARLFRVR
jgi:hypothetical protein